MTIAVRVLLPTHLRTMARVDGEILLELAGTVATHRAVFDALEARFPTLSGTVRDYSAGRRRAYLRLFACGLDLSHEDPETPLPEAVVNATEPYLIVGAISGGTGRASRPRQTKT